MEREQILEKLRSDIAAARERRDAANLYFDEVTRNLPSGIPHPDGVVRIEQASRECSSAREAVRLAYEKFTNYLIHGKLPPGLKDD